MREKKEAKKEKRSIKISGYTFLLTLLKLLDTLFY